LVGTPQILARSADRMTRCRRIVTIRFSAGSISAFGGERVEVGAGLSGVIMFDLRKQECPPASQHRQALSIPNEREPHLE